MKGDPEKGDLRWCGMCGRAEIFNDGWRPYRPEPGETLTVALSRTDDADANAGGEE